MSHETQPPKADPGPLEAVVSRCSVRDGKFVEPCKTLRAVCEGSPVGRGKGVRAWESYHLDGQPRPARTFFGVRSGDHATKGIAFNFCPFCGTKIDAPFSDG